MKPRSWSFTCTGHRKVRLLLQRRPSYVICRCFNAPRNGITFWTIRCRCEAKFVDMSGVGKCNYELAVENTFHLRETAPSSKQLVFGQTLDKPHPQWVLVFCNCV